MLVKDIFPSFSDNANVKAQNLRSDKCLLILRLVFFHFMYTYTFAFFHRLKQEFLKQASVTDGRKLLLIPLLLRKKFANTWTEKNQHHCN